MPNTRIKVLSCTVAEAMNAAHWRGVRTERTALGIKIPLQGWGYWDEMSTALHRLQTKIR